MRFLYLSLLIFLSSCQNKTKPVEVCIAFNPDTHLFRPYFSIINEKGYDSDSKIIESSRLSKFQLCIVVKNLSHPDFPLAVIDGSGSVYGEVYLELKKKDKSIIKIERYDINISHLPTKPKLLKKGVTIFIPIDDLWEWKKLNKVDISSAQFRACVRVLDEVFKSEWNKYSHRESSNMNENLEGILKEEIIEKYRPKNKESINLIE